MLAEFQNILDYPLIRFGQFELTLWTIVYFVVVLFAAFFLSRFFRRLLKDRVLIRTKMDVGLQYAIARVMGYIVFILGLFIGLETLGIDLTSFTVLAGAFGLGIGFGLQNIINNFVSGLIILSERIIQVDDRIEVGGQNGQLRKIGARCSLMTTPDNITVIIPNSEFITGKVVNWGRGTEHAIRYDVNVGVSYDSDLHLVEKILLDVALSHPYILKNPQPAVELVHFGESSIDFKLYMWTTEMSTKAGMLKSQIYFAIWDQFRAHQIEIPFPVHSIRFPDPIQIIQKQVPEQK